MPCDASLSLAGFYTESSLRRTCEGIRQCKSLPCFGVTAKRKRSTAMSKMSRARRRHRHPATSHRFFLCGIFIALQRRPWSGVAAAKRSPVGSEPWQSQSTRPPQPPPSRKQTSRDGPEELSAIDMVQWLDRAEVHVMVNVFLVGFRGESVSAGMNHVALDAATLGQHLRELVRGLSTDGSGGVPLTVVEQARENEVVRLRIRQETLFEVSHAAAWLSDRVTNAVESSIEAASQEAMTPEVVGIPRTAVDDAIRSFHNKQHISYGLYLLHPSVRGLYHYTHDGVSRATAEGGAGAGDGKRSDEKKYLFSGGCGYVGWVGQHERYAWMDLGAHVSHEWGPRTRALGIVSPFTLPDLRAAAATTRQRHTDLRLYPELAALAHRTASQLIVPPLLFAPAGFMGEDFRSLIAQYYPARWSDYAEGATPDQWRLEKAVGIHLFLVCQASPCSRDEVQEWEALDKLFDAEGRGNQNGGGGIMPRVVIQREEVMLWDSPILATGLQQALRPTRGSPPGTSLSASELRHWLRRFLDEREVVRRYDSGGDEVRVVPFFAFSLEADPPLLLDHSARSTPFPDMVISVKSRRGTVTGSTFQCGGRSVMLEGGLVGNSEKRRVNGVNIDGGLLRDTFASLAQVMWGAPPRSLSWDPVTETLGTDYLWATGASIHTPLSSHSSLTFVERDAYFRVNILRRVDAALGAARDVLAEAASVESRLATVLYRGDYAHAEESWYGVKGNLEKCLDELAVHNHMSALRFAGDLEKHVGNLGAALSKGYSHEAYRRNCRCEGPDETSNAWLGNFDSHSVGDGIGGRKLGDVWPMIHVMPGLLLVTVSVCFAFGAWFWTIYSRGRGRRVHGWRILRKDKLS